MRDAHLRIAYTDSSNGRDYSTQKAWDRELDLYKTTVESGIKPEGTTTDKIRMAERISEVAGVAYDSGTMPPSNLLTSKRVIKAAVEAGQM